MSNSKPLLGPCDSYQLEPFIYPWAWEMSRQQENNGWTPEEIAVGPDVADYKNPSLDPKHKHLFESVMAQLTTFDILRGDEIAETLQPIIQPAEIKHFLKRMAWDEALHCYEEGTEVLTSEGWVDFRDLSDDAIVAQVSMEGELSFTKHCGITRDFHEGVLYEWSNKAIHTSVTPNHRCVEILDHKNFGGRNGKWNIVKAQDLTQGNRLWPVAATSAHGATTDLSPMDRLRIAFQADGYMRSANRVTFHFSKARKISRISEILDACGLEYECMTYPSDPAKTQVHIRTPLRLSKRLADWVKLSEVSDSWAQQFIEELVHWDGNIKADGNYRWSCHDADGENMGLVQAIAVIAGRHGRISGPEMSLVNRSYVSPETANLIKKPYKGYVYSVGVPTGIIVTRFHNRVLISGNTRSYRFVIENLGIPLEIYTRYQTVPEFKARVDMCQEISQPLLDIIGRVYTGGCSLDALPTNFKQAILRSMIFYFLVFEGCWFWVSLMGPIQQLSRLGIFKGAAEQFTYVARDEQQHVGFGIALIREFMVQYPECITEEFLDQVYADVSRAIKLEEDYIQHCLKDGPILGYSAPEHVATAKFFANLRLASVGLKPIGFMDAYHAFPWMSEQMELKKEKNFFEKVVTDYRAGGALMFDDEHPHHEQPGWSDPLA